MSLFKGLSVVAPLLLGSGAVANAVGSILKIKEKREARERAAEQAAAAEERDRIEKLSPPPIPEGEKSSEKPENVSTYMEI